MNNITIELCTEDRARLDRLAAAIEQLITPVPPISVKGELFEPEQMSIDVEALTPTAESTQEPTEAQNEATPTTAPAEDVTPTEEPTEAQEPSVTLEQIQQKVMQLATANGGAKKATVRDIISTYGAKVSDLKEQPEKWDEVWKKLTALEGEA